jgi:hypothetical protein
MNSLAAGRLAGRRNAALVFGRFFLRLLAGAPPCLVVLLRAGFVGWLLLPAIVADDTLPFVPIPQTFVLLVAAATLHTGRTGSYACSCHCLLRFVIACAV